MACFCPSLSPSPPFLACSLCVPGRSSRYVSLHHLGCARKTDSPAVLYSAAKHNLPSLLGGGNESTRLPPLPDSDPTDGGSAGVGGEGHRRAADGKIHNNDGLNSRAPSAQSNHAGGFRCSSQPTTLPTSGHPPPLISSIHRPGT